MRIGEAEIPFGGQTVSKLRQSEIFLLLLQKSNAFTLRGSYVFFYVVKRGIMNSKFITSLRKIGIYRSAINRIINND